MNILFMGLIFDRSKEPKILRNSKIGLQTASNTFQWNLIDGLLENNCKLKIVNSLPVGTWPLKYKKILLSGGDWGYKGAECIETASLNLSVIKQKTRELSYIKTIKAWVNKSPDNRVIVAYSLYLPFLNALTKIKKIFPDIKVCIIVTDLPGKYGILPNNIIKSAIYNYFGGKSMDLTKTADSFVLLTPEMRYPLMVGKRPYAVIEGIAKNKNNKGSYCNTYGNGKKIVLYAGTLNRRFGIIELLNAFDFISGQEYELWFAGSGETEAEIERRAAVDSRIKFFGYITKEEVGILQSIATILINPRKNEGEYTKYSFPSKTLEYMISGVPVLMYKLDGIPDEYDDYLTYIKGSSTFEMAKSIEQICGKNVEELQCIGQRSKHFVETNKNPYKSAKEVIKIIEETNSESSL